MKKTIAFSFLLITAVCFTACGPAAENRDVMHQKAKRISDSIGRVIDAALAQSAIPPKTAAQPDTAAKAPAK